MATHNSPSLHQLLILTPARDAEDRPLLESKSHLMSAEEKRDARVRCPYSESPSRHEHEKPMNEEALAQVRRHFGGFLGLFGELSRRQAASSTNDRPGPDDWHSICLYGEVLPRLLLLRAHEAADDDRTLRQYFEPRLPIEVGIVFKTVRGLLRLTRALREDAARVIAVLPPARRTALGLDAVEHHKPKKRGKGHDRRTVWNEAQAREAFKQAPWTVEDLILVTERLELMVGDEEVCAAPHGMLEATFKVLVEGGADQPSPEIDPDVAAVLDDLDGLGRFALALDEVYGELDRFRDWNRRLGERSKQRLDTAARGAATAAVFDAALDEYLLEEHRFLARLSTLQAPVLEAARAKVVDPPLSLGMIDDMIPDSIRRAAEQRGGLRVDHTPDAIEVRRGSALLRRLPIE